MLAFQLDPNAELLKAYFPPFSGTWKTLPSQLVPDDALQDSLNVTILGGTLRSRLGHLRYSPSTFDNHIVGSFMFIDSMNAKYPLASSPTALYKYTGGWSDINSTILTGDVDHAVRMTSIQINTAVYLIYANGVNTLKYAENGVALNDIIPHVNTPEIPIFSDICTSFSRIVGITPPYTVSWCDVLNDEYLSFTSWPALNQVVLSDTEDALVAIRPLGTLGLAVYKEGNIFVGFPQSGSQANAFRFEHRGEYEGPAGPNAVVNVNGANIYMTPTGRVGYFDGSTQEWICDGIWPFLQDNLDTAYANRISGCYNYRTSEVYFYYPGINSNGACNKMVIIDIPYPTAGITTYSYFLGETFLDVRNALSVRLFNASTSPLVFGYTGTLYLSYSLDKSTYTDDGRAFDCSIQSGLFRPEPLPTGDIIRPILELYASRDSSRKTVDLSAVTSNNLENRGNLSTETERIDLTASNPNEYIGYNDSGSFLGIKLTWKSDANLEYKGCDVYGRRNN